MAKDPAARYPSAGDLGRAARAAAAGERGPAPERTVARGAAAPGGEAVTAISPAADAPTVVSARPRARPRRALVLAAAILVCAGVAATLWLGRDPARPRAATVASLPAATATPDGPQVGETLRHVGFRPRDVAVAGGAVWVLSIHEPRIARLDPRTGSPRGEQPYIGRGAADMAADRGIGLGRQARDEPGARPGRAQRRRRAADHHGAAACADRRRSGGLWVVDAGRGGRAGRPAALRPRG